MSGIPDGPEIAPLLPSAPPPAATKKIPEKKVIAPKLTEKKTAPKSMPAKPVVKPDPAPQSPAETEYLFETPGVPGMGETSAVQGDGEPDGVSGGIPGGVPGGYGTGRAVLDASSLKVTKKVAPDYPMISRKRKEAGTVVLLIEIASGRVESVEVESSSGHAPLDESAVRAVREWKFDAGHGAAVTARIPFTFDLK
jgi:protein TonB